MGAVTGQQENRQQHIVYNPQYKCMLPAIFLFDVYLSVES